MPFGLRNAARTFQKSLDQVPRDLSFAVMYTDEALIARTHEHEHRENLRLVFQSFQEQEIPSRISECILDGPSIEFLGQNIDGEGISPLQSKVSAIHDYRHFLGIINC